MKEQTEQKTTMAARIAALRAGQSFTVKSVADRQEALRHIKSLREAGVLVHDVKTLSSSAGFKIYAI